MKIFSLALLIPMGLLLSCEALAPAQPLEDSLLDGPIEGLSQEELSQFLEGDIAFNEEIFTAQKGLGPIFVSTSCGSCHPGDGKGHPFVRFTRYGQRDSTGNTFLHLGGPQLQHRAIAGYQPESLPAGAPHADFIAPAVTGLGLLDAVSDNDLIALSDPDDLDGDGISGRPHYTTLPTYAVPRQGSVPHNGRYISRFGKKAAAYDLLHQTALAYKEDIGITSVFEPHDPYTGLEEDPEVTTQTINDVVFYLKTLKPPIPRDQSDPNVMAGKQLFNEIQCSACHTPVLNTGPSPIEALAHQEIYPYTDLLLHDMGPALDDGYTEGYAISSEWRTPPLWGLGLSKDSQGGSYYLLHDGRAESIEEAILLHGGEAQQAKELFDALSDTEKIQLITFLESL